MLTMFCYDGLAVIVENLFFGDPQPAPGQEGQEGQEQGVRVELRLVEQRPWRGSVYASQPVVVDRSVLRVDLLESVAASPGSRERTEDPVGWLESRLADPMQLLADAGIPDLDLYQAAAAGLRDTLPEITRAVATMLAKVSLGRLALVPAARPDAGGRAAGVYRSGAEAAIACAEAAIAW